MILVGGWMNPGEAPVGAPMQNHTLEWRPILVVEDDPQVLRAIRQGVERAGWASAGAATAQEGRDSLIERPGGLIADLRRSRSAGSCSHGLGPDINEADLKKFEDPDFRRRTAPSCC